ncbi:MAG: Tll0287-like domain-containing protein [Nitrospiraceae bacterium]
MRWTLSLTVVPVMVLSSLTMAGRAADLPGIPPETVTDYIHAVIEADRTFYTIHVVERMQKQGGSPAAENWRAEKKTLPLPAQFLAEASDLASKTGTKVRYRLISLWPINPNNGPDGEPEKKGLEAVREHPERSATSTVKIDDQTYFKAIYAGHAVSQSCVGCHNTHPHSPKQGFKIDDVMGGLVIEIPLGK